MKYVITGGAGFIGSHLARALLQQGHMVDVVDSLSTGSLSNLSGMEDKIKFHNADIRDGAKLRELLAGRDGIFHHAALTSVSESYKRQGEYQDVNVHGTRNVLDAAMEAKTKVVFASSSSVYGNTGVIPTPESAELSPVNPYGVTKLEAEKLARQYGKAVDVVGLRYYNVYGGNPEKSSAGVISRFYRNVSEGKPPVIDGDGLQVRDFVFIGDVISATCLAMEKKTGTAFVNIGSGMKTSILDLANIFIKHSGKPLKPVFGKELEGNVKQSQADISLAARLLGWQPQTKLEEWIAQLNFNS